jgi:hypothetical protein
MVIAIGSAGFSGSGATTAKAAMAPWTRRLAP